MNPEEAELIARMADDAAVNGDHMGGALLHGLLLSASPDHAAKGGGEEEEVGDE